MVCRILECRRSESTSPYPPEVVQSLVEELRLISQKKDPDGYIRIFADLSFAEFQSLSNGYAAQYGDIISELRKFSGDFFNLLLARCSEKYDYLCYRLHTEGADAIPRYSEAIILLRFLGSWGLSKEKNAKSLQQNLMRIKINLGMAKL